MKAITIWQPWASMIALGMKPYEFRGWPAPNSIRGQRIAIHAGARPVRRSEVQDLLLRIQKDGGFGMALVIDKALPFLERVLTSPGILPLSHIVCTAILGEPVRANKLAGEADSDRIAHHMWGWPLTNLKHLEPPEPAKGAQGFWDWNAETVAA